MILSNSIAIARNVNEKNVEEIEWRLQSSDLSTGWSFELERKWCFRVIFASKQQHLTREFGTVTNSVSFTVPNAVAPFWQLFLFCIPDIS